MVDGSIGKSIEQRTSNERDSRKKAQKAQKFLPRISRMTRIFYRQKDGRQKNILPRILTQKRQGREGAKKTKRV